MRSDARKREATPSEAGEFPVVVSDADILATPEEAGVVPDWPLTEAEERMVYRHLPWTTPGHMLAEVATDVARIRDAAVQAERERVLALMEAVLARVRCEAVHQQTNGGRCVNCILWAKNVGVPQHLEALARGES